MADRWVVALAGCAVHLAILVPTIGQEAGSVVNDFAPEAILIEAGDSPYGDQDLEYPPLSIPVLLAPAMTSEGIDGYNDHFEAWMLLFDLAIVALLAFGTPGDRRRAIEAVGVYTLGVLALSGIVLADSDIDEAPLALARFDLVPVALGLAAVFARGRGLSATWAALLSTAVAVKAFPLVLAGALARGERRPARAALAAAVPIAIAAGIVLGYGDGFGSAISYQTERPLQIESVAATPLEIAAMDDVSRGARFGSGSYNFVAPGSEEAKAASVAVLALVLALLLAAGWLNREISDLRLGVALIAAVAILSPVLSPQFLFWVLPLSAAAFGLRPANWVLIGAFVMTELMLDHYARVVVDFDPEFVWRLAGRNLLLLVYLGMVVWPVLRDGLGPTLAAWPRASST